MKTATKTATTMRLLVVAAWGGSARADTVTLESAALRLEVTTSPYAYRVLEKASGTALVIQSGTTFAVPGAVADGGAPDALAADGGDASAPDAADAAVPDAASSDGPDAAAAIDAQPAVPPPPPPVDYPVSAASNVQSTATTLDADLAVTGSSDLGHVRFTFASPDVLEVTLTFAGTPALRVTEKLQDQQEEVYGIWEYPFGGKIGNRGISGDYLGVNNNPGSSSTSGRAPFFVTSRHYGVYVRSDRRGHFSIANPDTSFAFDDASLKYDVIHGASYYEVLARYTTLAGGPLLPPLWAQGVIWWSDDFNQDLHGMPDAQSNVLDLATQLQSRKIPGSGLLIDRPYGTGRQGWGNMDFSPSFPDPPAMASGLHERGLELVLWIANRAWNTLYDEGLAKGYLFAGNPNNGPAVDLRNPAAYDWFKAKLDPLVALGTKGYKIDRGEEGEMPAAVQNQVVTLFARLAREGLEARHGADVYQIARNAADSGRKYTALWNGDSQATFDGLKYSIAGGIRTGLIVMPMWGSDTGGYFRTATGPTEELFARWLGFSAFSPMMEVLVGQSHTPWYDYSPALVEIARKHAAAHFDLIPYTRSFLAAATTTGAPVIRPMFLEFPDAPALADQYLFGTELLVAPVITAGATTRTVTVPAGRWLDYNGRHLSFTTGTATLDAPLDTIPVLVREGAIVPRGAVLRGNDNWTAGWAPKLHLEVFPADHDLSRSFDYYTGQATRTITAATAGGKLTVTFDDLGVPGTVEVQTKTAGTVTLNGKVLAPADYKLDGRVLSVPCSGATNLVVEGLTSLFVPDPPAPDGGGDATASASSGGGCSCTTGPGRPGGALLLVLLLSYRVVRRRRSAAP
jgi:alpha-D-xyloside xylohydrolase